MRGATNAPCLRITGALNFFEGITMDSISRIFWRGGAGTAFMLLSQFLYDRDLSSPADWPRWRSSFEATCVAFVSFLSLLIYLATVLCLTPDKTEQSARSSCLSFNFFLKSR